MHIYNFFYIKHLKILHEHQAKVTKDECSSMV